MMNKAISAAVLVWTASSAFAAPAPIEAGVAQHPATDVATLQSRVAELESRLAQVERGESWLTDQRASEIRGIVQNVLADADSRASLQGSGMNAGWDKGFFLASPDGNFKLKIEGQLQFRFVYSSQEDSTGLTTTDATMLGIINGTGNGVFFSSAGGTIFPDLAVTATLAPTSFLTLVNNVPLMQALQFTEAERVNLLNFYTGLGPGQRGDRDFTFLQFVGDRIDGLTPAQKDAFAAALGAAINLRNASGVPVTFSSFAEYESFREQLFQAQLVARRVGDQHRSGFENRRTKIAFSGHVVSPQWKYFIQGAFNRNGGAFDLEDAWIDYDFGGGWFVRAGQFKLPVLMEELNSSKRLQAVERSLVNAAYSVVRGQGIMLDYKGDHLHLTVAVSDGARSNNTVWSVEDNEGLAVSARGEYLVAGDWKQFDDYASWQGEVFGAKLGAAVHYEKDEYGTGTRPFGSSIRTTTPNNNEEETFLVTADAQLEFGGANLFGYFVYRSREFAETVDMDQWAFVIQGGIFVTPEIELFARYEWSDADIADIRSGGVTFYSFDDLNIVTVGATKYFSKHTVKWTTDVGFAFDRVEFPFASDSAGWRSDTGGDDGQVVVRSQLQLLF